MCSEDRGEEATAGTLPYRLPESVAVCKVQKTLACTLRVLPKMKNTSQLSVRLGNVFQENECLTFETLFS